ncbi:cystathionine gamma-synthase [Limibacillus sp. MBR-115]
MKASPMPGSKSYDTETLIVHALNSVDPATRSVVPAWQPSTTFARDEAYEPLNNRVYGRDQGVTLQQAEAVLARLEEGADAMLFASGMGAATAVLQTLQRGDRLLVQRVMYWTLRDWLLDLGEQWGFEVDFFDAAGGLNALEAALRPGETKLVWLEVPANPTWDIVDIAGAARLAHEAGARLAVDSTIATPVLTRPLGLGADIVMHSATKYLGGHSDILAGLLVTAKKDDQWSRMCRLRLLGGSQLGSFDSWLLIRSLRTLFVRVRQSSANALAVARHFDGDPRLEDVLYPGLQRHPQHEIAKRQMDGGFGGMLSLRVRGGFEGAQRVAANCKLILRATSLGGVESLIEHRAAVEGPDSPIPQDLLRISIGIERVEDLISDLDQAL